MVPVINPWAPGFRRLTGIGQMTPSVTAAAPSTTPAPKTGGAGKTAVAVGVGALVLGVASVGVLFTYGIASESKSGLVKTTGYILAGAGALVALVEAVGIGAVIISQ